MISILSDINQFAGLMRTDPRLLIQIAAKKAASKGTTSDEINQHVDNTAKEGTGKVTKKTIKNIIDAGR